MNFILSCFRYLFDFCFFGVCSFLMFLAFLTQAPKAVQKAELRTIMMPRIKIHGELTHALSSPLMPRTDTPPDQEIQTSALLHAGDSGADIFCSRHFEDMQLSFLLVLYLYRWIQVKGLFLSATPPATSQIPPRRERAGRVVVLGT